MIQNSLLFLPSLRIIKTPKNLIVFQNLANPNTKWRIARSTRRPLSELANFDGLVLGPSQSSSIILGSTYYRNWKWWMDKLFHRRMTNKLNATQFWTLFRIFKFFGICLRVQIGPLCLLLICLWWMTVVVFPKLTRRNETRRLSVRPSAALPPEWSPQKRDNYPLIFTGRRGGAQSQSLSSYWQLSHKIPVPPPPSMCQ